MNNNKIINSFALMCQIEDIERHISLAGDMVRKINEIERRGNMRKIERNSPMLSGIRSHAYMMESAARRLKSLLDD